MVPMRATEILNRLQQDGTSFDEAVLLARQALDRIGGEHRVSYHQGGLGAGRRRKQRVDEFFVPWSAIRS